MKGTKKRFALWGGALSLGIGVLIAAGVGPAIGEDEAAQRLLATCEGRGTAIQKLSAVQALGKLDTKAGHAALESVAVGKDGPLAARACVAMGLANYPGAKQALMKLFEDPKRSHAARVGAFVAYARSEMAAGTPWGTVEAYGLGHCDKGSKLEASILAAKNGISAAQRRSGGR